MLGRSICWQKIGFCSQLIEQEDISRLPTRPLFLSHDKGSLHPIRSSVVKGHLVFLAWTHSSLGIYFLKISVFCQYSLWRFHTIAKVGNLLIGGQILIPHYFLFPVLLAFEISLFFKSWPRPGINWTFPSPTCMTLDKLIKPSEATFTIKQK